MLSKYTFIPNIESVGFINARASPSQIESEPPLFQCSLKQALEIGGPLTRRVLENIKVPLTEGTKHYVIDTKSVHLMEGMYPALPGYHCDNVTRTVSQPDLSKLNPDLFFYTCLIGSYEVSRTKFINKDIEIVYDTDRVWESVNDVVSGKDKMRSEYMPFGNIFKFSQPTLHTSTMADKNAWRYFFRMRETDKEVIGRIRNQTFVYLGDFKGW